MINLIVSIFLLLVSSVYGKDVLNVTILETPSLPPEGVISFGVNYSQSSFENEYSNNGRKVDLANLMNKEFSYNDVLKQEQSPLKRKLTEGALAAYGINDFESSAGTHRGKIDIDTEVYSLFLSYAPTNDLSFFAVLPIVNVSVNFSNNFTPSQSFNQMINQLEREGNYVQVDEIKNKLSNPIRYQLQEYGYRANYPSETQSIGDLRLMSRWRYYKNDTFENTLGIFGVLPTGKKNDVNNFFDLYLGDGQYDIGIESLHGYKLNRSWSLVLTSSYTHQIEKTEATRIPQDSDDILSPDIDRNTKIKYGDIIRLQLQTNYRLNDTWSFSLGHLYQYKEEDRYQGNSYSPVRYRYLEKETEQNLQALFAGVTFNSISAFLKKKFLIPMNLSLTYSETLSGKNSLSNREIALSLLSFYK